MGLEIPFYRKNIFIEYFEELRNLSNNSSDLDISSWLSLCELIDEVLTLEDLDKYKSAKISLNQLYNKLQELKLIEEYQSINFTELNQIVEDQIKGFTILFNGGSYEFTNSIHDIVTHPDLEKNLDGTFRNFDPNSEELEQMKSFMNEFGIAIYHWNTLIKLISVGSVNLEIFQQLYRSIHNLKGVASFFSEFTDVFIKICHETESFFQEIIDGRIKVLSQNQIECILRIFNVLKILFNNLDRFLQGREPYYDNLDLRKILSSIRLMSISEKVSPEDILPTRLSSLDIGESVRISAIQLDELIETIHQIKLDTTELIIKYRMVDSVVRDLQFLENSILRVQDSMQEMRLFPIGLLFENFSKQVHELQKQLDKSVSLEFHGADTRVDSTISDSIVTPLVHLVRNAMDHGIESPAERTKLGKAIRGQIIISAICRQNEILFEVSDDGRGIDEDLIRKIADERGMDSSLQLQDILCSPGFTSKKCISTISGRGAGMDAVLAEVKRIGGYLSLESRLNEGSTVRLTLPLDFYSDDFLIIQSNQLNYLLSVQNVLQICDGSEELTDLIPNILNCKNYSEKIPELSLNKILDHPENSDKVSLLLDCYGKRFMVLTVTKLLGKKRLMVKPLRSPFLQRNRIVSYAGRLADGMLACVLDVNSLYDHVGLK